MLLMKAYSKNILLHLYNAKSQIIRLDNSNKYSIVTICIKNK